MPLTLTPPAARPRTRRTALSVAAVVVLVGVALRLLTHLDDASRTAVTFTNDSPWTIEVALVVSASGRVPLGDVGTKTEQTMGELARPRSGWAFAFSYGDHRVTTRLTDAELERLHHRVAVPQRLLAQLRQAGAPPSPY